MRYQPFAELITCERYISSGLISRVDFGVDNMTFGKSGSHYIMDVSGKALETRLGADKTMKIDE